MVNKFFPEFIIGLGAVIGLFLSFFFLIALLIVQPLEFAVLPRRQWMHLVTVEWLIVSLGLSMICTLALWVRTPNLSKAKAQKGDTTAETDSAPSSWHAGPQGAGVVWVCNFNASPLVRPIAADHVSPDYPKLVNRYRKGEVIARAEVPTSFVLQGKRVHQDIMIGDFFFISDKVADILKRFDLGQNKLIPLEGIYHGHDRTKLETEYFILTLLNQKSAFAADHCEPEAIWRFAKGIPIWGMYLNDFADGVIAVTENSLEGPDLWMDPATPQQFYASDRLKAALDTQGIGEKMGFKRCRIV